MAPQMLSDRRSLGNKQRWRGERGDWVVYCILGCSEIDRVSKKLVPFVWVRRRVVAKSCEWAGGEGWMAERKKEKLRENMLCELVTKKILQVFFWKLPCWGSLNA